MHIGFLTPEYVTKTSVDGGLANYVRKAGLALCRRGHRVSVLVLSDRDADYHDQELSVYEISRVKLPYLPAIGSFLPMVSQIYSARKLAAFAHRMHRKSPFSIFQAASYLAPGYALRGKGQVPMVCRVSSYSPLWRSAYGRTRSLGEYLSDWLEIRQVLDAEAAFAPSEFLARIYARFEGCQLEVIRTPIDTDPLPFDRTFYDKHLAGSRYLLFFGTLSRIKGVDLLAQVLPAVLERHPSLKVAFLGRDDGLPDGQKVFECVRAQCQPFSERLCYHRPIAKAQLGPVIENATGVLVPSRVDNYPNVCLEAHALGVPVVGTYDSSLDEMIVDGETGFLASNGEPDALLYAIERLLALAPRQRDGMRNQILASIQSVRAEDRVGQLVSFYQAVIHSFEKVS